MPKEKILAVDDEADIIELIRFNLEREGYRVRCAESGERCMEIVRSTLPDAIILDLMLPGIDGMDVCRRIKSDSKTAHIPVIMLTAKGDEADIVTGLELGADDYIVKPFSPKVLLARLKSVLRRKSIGESEETVRRGDLVINIKRREVFIKGAPVADLTFTEFEVLRLLAQRPGWVFTRKQIVLNVKGDDYPVTERAVDVQIVGLRRKLGGAGDLIETVRGVGYRFKDS